MSGAVVNERTGELTPQGRRVLELARQPRGVTEIATELGIKRDTVRVYFSQLRKAGYALPRNASGDMAADDDVTIIIRVPPAVAAELRQQAVLRGLRPTLSLATVQAIVTAIHADNLYDAVLGKVPKAGGRAA